MDGWNGFVYRLNSLKCTDTGKPSTCGANRYSFASLVRYGLKSPRNCSFLHLYSEKDCLVYRLCAVTCIWKLSPICPGIWTLHFFTSLKYWYVVLSCIVYVINCIASRVWQGAANRTYRSLTATVLIHAKGAGIIADTCPHIVLVKIFKVFYRSRAWHEKIVSIPFLCLSTYIY